MRSPAGSRSANSSSASGSAPSSMSARRRAIRSPPHRRRRRRSGPLRSPPRSTAGSPYLLGRGFRLEQGNCLSARGFFKSARDGTPHTIRLADGLPPDDGRLKTFLHEAAHFLAGHHEQGNAWDDKPRKELEAEGIAFAAMDSWGMDSSQYSFSYLATYGRTVENLRQAMPVIAATTRTLIELVAGEQPDGEAAWL